MKTRLHALSVLAWLTGLGLLAAGAWGWWAKTDSTTRRSWLVVEPLIVSAGRLALGEPYIVRLRVANRHGDRPARLLGASDSCDAAGCASSIGLPQTIVPGGSGTVELEYKGLRAGPFRREVSLYSDCPGQAEIVLIIAGEVVGAKDDAARREPDG